MQMRADGRRGQTRPGSMATGSSLFLAALLLNSARVRCLFGLLLCRRPRWQLRHCRLCQDAQCATTHGSRGKALSQSVRKEPRCPRTLLVKCCLRASAWGGHRRPRQKSNYELFNRNNSNSRDDGLQADIFTNPRARCLPLCRVATGRGPPRPQTGGGPRTT